MNSATTSTTPEGFSDPWIIESCGAAGLRWIPPNDDGFPGMFDMARMEEMRTVFGLAARRQPGLQSRIEQAYAALQIASGEAHKRDATAAFVGSISLARRLLAEIIETFPSKSDAVPAASPGEGASTE